MKCLINLNQQKYHKVNQVTKKTKLKRCDSAQD